MSTTADKKRIAEYERLCRRLLKYFGGGAIDKALDSDSEIRDMALTGLGEEPCGHKPLPSKFLRKYKVDE